MRDVQIKRNGEPDPTIEEIERAIRKARFDESETEKFVRDRHHIRARHLARAKYKDDAKRQAFIAGYRMGAHVPDWHIVVGAASFIGLASLFSLLL